jgi:hypothetical protein
MAPTPLGREALKQLLSAPGRVVIVNRSTPADDLTIVAAVIVRHDTAGSARQLLTDLDLAADESEWVDPPTPASEPATLLEVLLRLSLNGQLVETYLFASPPDTPATLAWEVGIRMQDGPSGPGDVSIPELPRFAAYLVPFQ